MTVTARRILATAVPHVPAAGLLGRLDAVVAANIREKRCVLTGGRLVRMVYGLALPDTTDYDLMAAPGNVANLVALVRSLRTIPEPRPKIDIFYGADYDTTVNNFDMDVVRLYLTDRMLVQGSSANQPVVVPPPGALAQRRITILRKPGTGILRSTEMDADTRNRDLKRWSVKSGSGRQTDMSATEAAFAMGLEAHPRIAGRARKYWALFEDAGYRVTMGLEDGGRLFPDQMDPTVGPAHNGNMLWKYLCLAGNINICYLIKTIGPNGPPPPRYLSEPENQRRKKEVAALIEAFPECAEIGAHSLRDTPSGANINFFTDGTNLALVERASEEE